MFYMGGCLWLESSCFRVNTAICRSRIIACHSEFCQTHPLCMLFTFTPWQKKIFISKFESWNVCYYIGLLQWWQEKQPHERYQTGTLGLSKMWTLLLSTNVKEKLIIITWTLQLVIYLIYFYLFILLCIQSINQSFVHSFVHSFIHSFFFIPSLIHSFVRLFIHSFIHSCT